MNRIIFGLIIGLLLGLGMHVTAQDNQTSLYEEPQNTPDKFGSDLFYGQNPEMIKKSIMAPTPAPAKPVSSSPGTSKVKPIKGVAPPNTKTQTPPPADYDFSNSSNVPASNNNNSNTQSIQPDQPLSPLPATPTGPSEEFNRGY